mgnify:CR=1 FL=1
MRSVIPTSYKKNVNFLGVFVPNPAGREVPALGQDHPPGHQARQPTRQQQLCTQDLRLRPSQVRDV